VAWGLRTDAVKKAPQRIETARLLLTPPMAGDAGAIFSRYASDPEVTRFLGWPRHRSVAETEAFLAFSAREWTRTPAGPYLIWSRPGGVLLGATGLVAVDAGRAITGYVLAQDAWGKGYATEALHAMVEVARGIGVEQLNAVCHHQHRGSWRVLEKCGFTRAAGTHLTGFPNLSPVEQAAFTYTRRVIP
jgi:RimJ/RimL family protein N-acetyltransferase